MFELYLVLTPVLVGVFVRPCCCCHCRLHHHHHHGRITTIIILVLILVYSCCFLFCSVLFWSGLQMREGYETNDEGKKNLNLHLSKSPHHILDSCISDQPHLWTIIFSKLYPMRQILLPPELSSG